MKKLFGFLLWLIVLVGGGWGIVNVANYFYDGVYKITQPVLEQSYQSRCIKIKIEYAGQWAGAVNKGWTKQESYSGCGDREIEVGSVGYAGATIQKQSESSSELRVLIIRGTGEVIESGSTTAAYGLVAIGSKID